jgi:hypothetical protein
MRISTTASLLLLTVAGTANGYDFEDYLKEYAESPYRDHYTLEAF